MSSQKNLLSRPTVGILGFGAFGRLVATHLAPYCALRAYDPATNEIDFSAFGAERVGLAEAARCPIVILAAPVSRLAESLAEAAPHLQPGALLIDVGSVKAIPAEILRAGAPGHVELLATHPLFGPQSAANGIEGLKIVLCPLRGRRWRRVAAFLRGALRLRTLLATPEAHDRELATAQGLTHFIAKVLVAMEPLPTRMTTRSFDLIRQAVDMVRHDAPEVFQAIERANPYAPAVRRRFFELAAELEQELDGAAR